MVRDATDSARGDTSSIGNAPLTEAQKQLWILAQTDDDASRAYNVPLILRLRGQLDIAAMRYAIQAGVDRHEALRTTIGEDGEEQRVHDFLNVDVPIVDLPKAEDRDNKLTETLTSQSSTFFDLHRGPLFRACIIKLDDQDHLLSLVAHHIVVDGWSMIVLVKDIAAAYAAKCDGEVADQEPPLQFREYANWLSERLADPRMHENESYWLDHLANPPELELPSYQSRPPLMTYRGARHTVTMNAELVEKLNALSQQSNGTLFMTLLAGYMALLHRLSGQDDLIVGVPVTKRSLKGGGDLVGYCVNMVPIRDRITEDVSFKEYFAGLRDTLLQAYMRADYPFSSLLKKLNLKRDPSRSPLVTAVFNMNPVLTGQVDMPGLDMELFEPVNEHSRHELSLNVISIKDELLLEFEYRTDLFDAATIERLAQRLIALFESATADPSQRFNSLPVLTDQERQHLLVDWNATETKYPKGQCLHQWIEAQAEKMPEATAVRFEDQSLSYAELNARANQLAHHLRTLEVGPDVLVGICVERSIEMVVGLLGVIKAGGAYVPLDPVYPGERLAYMLADAKAPVLLTQQRLVDGLPEHQAQVFCLDSDWGIVTEESATNPINQTTVDDLAYVIYTSGSTGKPKGVAVPHRGIVNRLQWMQAEYRLDETDRVLQKTPFSFDVSVWEFFWPLMTGARLVVAKPGGHKDSAYLTELIAEQGITTLHFVPPMLAMFLEEPGIEAYTSLRRIICSGEALPFELMQRYYSRLVAPLHNLYGPTEASVDVTYWACDPDTTLPNVPIGRPIANTQMYILDANLNPVPVGVAGELHIGGVGLARGYINRPELTAEKFIANPFSDEPGERLYKTGDLARYLPDGNIEFLGRIDHQVKIRGFRIELGEIEATLLQHDVVREAVVIAREDHPGDRRLAAYVVAALGVELDAGELRAYLKDRLPDYMAPAAFVVLDALPLSPNGKVDRKALPAPELPLELAQDYVAPSTMTEQLLAEIWAEILGVERVGIQDNFFELGGDSILGIQVISRANQAGFKVTPKQLFEHQTVAELATVAHQAHAVQAEQGLVTGQTPLTPIQQWFFEAELPEPQHFNQSVLLEVQQTLDPTRLESAIGTLIEHHDALRMRFQRTESGWRQVNAEPVPQSMVTFVDLSSYPPSSQSAEMEAKAAELQASLNLNSGPLVRAVLFRLGADQPDRLLLIIHHLVVDGVSWRILLEDLQTLHGQLEMGQPRALPPKTTSFKRWAERLQAYADSELLRDELEYWINAAKELPRSLPVDTPGGTNTVATAQTETVSLTADETRALLQEAPAAYNTQINDLLLTALTQTISAWVGTKSLSVHLEGHGREPIFDDEDVSRTVGWFTTLFPVHLDLTGITGTGDAIKAIKEQLREIPHKGLGYGVLRYLATDSILRSVLKTIPQPQISFNYLGQFDYMMSEGALFQPVQEGWRLDQNGSQARSHLFDINASVVDGVLSVGWTYSAGLHRAETVEHLAREYIEALRGLIAHCLAPEVGGYTPSDFSDAELSQDDLDELLVEYENASHGN